MRGAAIIRTKGGFGDMLNITVALRKFTEKHPDIPVDFYASKPYDQVVDHNPRIRTLVTLEADDKGLWRPLVWESYDLVFEMLGPEAKIERVQRQKVRLHRIEMWCNAVGCAYDGETVPEYYIQPIEAKAALSFWRGCSFPTPGGKIPIVGIQITSNNPMKDWPQGNWTALQKRVSKELGAFTIIFGKERTKAWENEATRCLADLTFRESMAVLRFVDVIVTPDSGYHHAASVFDKDAVALFGYTDAWLSSAKRKGRVYQHPIYKHTTVVSHSHEQDCVCWAWDIPKDVDRSKPMHCMQSITVDEVFREVERILAARGGRLDPSQEKALEGEV